MYVFCNVQHILRHRKLHLFLLLLIGLTVVTLWYEETNNGSLINWYGNFYRQIVYRQIYVRRSDLPDGLRLNISVVVVVNDGDQLRTEYALAHQTVLCYCQLHGYPLAVIDLSEWRHQRAADCPQHDFMFRRHCALAKWLSRNPSVEYALFLDADMGVINPDHLLEHFLAKFSSNLPSVDANPIDLIFYERIFNGEIMAGSYWARNTRFAVELLHFWANFTVPLRTPFRGGTDNGAIHAVFLELICGQKCSGLSARCLDLWANARHFGELRPFELCVRAILGARQQFGINFNTSAGQVLLVTNFRQSWARDGWLTGNQWSSNDFILHGWQNRRLDQPMFARWHSPLVLHSVPSPNKSNSAPLTNCAHPTNASRHWPYKESFMASEEQIGAQIEAIVRRRRQEDIQLLAQILV